MRWSGQQVLDDGIGEETALPGLRGLLRSVRTPEFAGTVFHEVEAKSVLNRVPSASPMPFSWTVNPYRGCSHACVYCLSGDTRILLADGRTRPIAELREGDAVLGTRPVGPDGRRVYVRTSVLAHWSTRRPAYRVTLADGTRLVTSGEHRFLTDRGWRHVAPGWCRSGRRPYLKEGSVLRGPGAAAFAAGTHGPGGVPASRGSGSRGSGPRGSGRREDGPYREGYLCGVIRADGAPGRTAPGESFPSEWLELEALGRAHHLLAGLRAHAALAVGAPGERPALAGVVGWPEQPSAAWSEGFVAGVLDAAGEVSGGALRIVTSDEALMRRAADALRRLGFRVGVDAGPVRGGRSLRLLGGAAEHLRLVRAVDPAVARLRDLDGALLEPPPAGGLEVLTVEALGTEIPMFDITTGTGDFVAEGVISHNCFARNTHTYLDLDAGKDFDGQIIVKVNVARVLERELAAPRWNREPVAMGTNTDPYQRAEGRYRLMPGIIRALARSGTPFSVLTKGTVLGRDLPDLTAAAADVPVGLGVSIALLDRGLQAHLEPGTPSPGARLDLVRRITDAGLGCGVMVAPVLPHLTDSSEALDALLGRIAAAGATGASVLALHLRPGTREWFMAWLAREYPPLVPRYEQLYRRGAYVDPGYRRALGARVVPLLRRHGLTGAVTPALRGVPEQAPDPGPEQLSLL
ncbi:MAG: intein-containing Rv2578c family radical SAM protein [Pseudonocardia sp.]|nr:intein-containing Rv2578c family radical SAM protein [Pseudonocardia sp.]